MTPNEITDVIKCSTHPSGPKFLKTGFWDYGWPKRSIQWPHFLARSWGHRPFSASVAATTIFPPKIGLFEKASKSWFHQLIDYSLLSYHKKFIQSAKKWLSNCQKRIPIFEMILRTILAHIHNLAKCKFF